MAKHKIASGSFARPANTVQYAAGDIVANSVTAGSVVPVALAAGVPNHRGVVNRVRLFKSGVSLVASAFRVHLFERLPTSAAGDNAAISVNGRLARHIGSVDLTIATAHSDGAGAIAAPASTTVYEADGAGQLYALVEARDTYTPVSGETFAVTLEVTRD